MALPSNAKTFGRFLIVGGANTAIDFGVLFLLTTMGLGVWPANTISTSVALVFSFFANRAFTFKAIGRSATQVFWFIAVTLCGLWVLQPLVILGATEIFSSASTRSALLLFGAKVLATCVTLAWNFVLYKKLVFAPSPVSNAEATDPKATT